MKQVALWLLSRAHDSGSGAQAAHAPGHTHSVQCPRYIQTELTGPGFPVCITLFERREARCSALSTGALVFTTNPELLEERLPGSGGAEGPLGVPQQLQLAWASLARGEHTPLPPSALRGPPNAAALRLAELPEARPELRNKGWHRSGASRDRIGSILAFHSSLLCPSEIILTLR